MFWPQRQQGDTKWDGVFYTGATLIIVCKRAVKQLKMSYEYPNVAVCVGDGRTTRTRGMLYTVIHLASWSINS